MAASTGTGNYPDVVQANNANDSAFISTGHTVTLTDHVTNCNFFRIDEGATLVGNGFSITVDNDSSDNSFINNGTISGVLDVIITNPNGNSNFNANGQGGNVRNLTVNHSNAIVRLKNEDQTLDGDLTILAGQLTTNDGSADRNLTVAGKTLVNGGTLTCNSSTISLKSGVNSNIFGLQVNIGTFDGGTGSHTIGGIRVSGGTLTFTSGNTTINAGETTSSAGSIYISGSPTVNTSNGTVIIDSSSTLQFLLYNSNLTLHNLTINSGSTTRLWQPTSDGSGTELLTVAGDLTINGTLDTDFSSQDDVNLTVTGDCIINNTGILTGNASAISLGSLAVNSGGTYSATSGTTTITSEASSGYAIEVSGTYTHNSGTLKITTDANSLVKILDDVNHLIIEPATATRVYEYVNNTTIQGNLTINAGRFTHYSSTYSLDVQGDCAVNNTGILDGGSGSIELGSLSVASGGEYRATTGTTTITKNNGGTDGRAFFIHASATFNHNNGLVKFTAGSPQVAPMSTGQTATSHPFYDLEQTSGTIQWKAEHHRVLNNCTMKGSAFNGSTGNVHVLGICRLTGETFNSGDTATNDNNFFQTLVIESGATVDLSAINITVGSLRNLGGTIQ